MLIVETDCHYPLPLTAHPTRTFGPRYGQAMELSLEYLKSLAASHWKACGTIIGSGPFKRPDTDTELKEHATAVKECWSQPFIEKKVTQDGIKCSITQWAHDFGEFSPDSSRSRHIQHRVNQ